MGPQGNTTSAIPSGDTRCTPPLTREQVDSIFGGALTALGGPAVLTPMQRMVAAATARSLTGEELDPMKCLVVTPEQLAKTADDGQFTPQFRLRVIQYMGLIALTVSPISEATWQGVDRYAEALGVSEACAEILHPAPGVTVTDAAYDFARNGYAAEFAEVGDNSELHAEPSTEVAGWQEVPHDEQLAAQWNALSNCPQGSLGRGVIDFYHSRRFNVPGTPDSAPPLLAQHDWVHVLANYGTNLECEIEVFGFLSATDDDRRGFSLLAMILGLFDTGTVAQAAGMFEADAGHFDGASMSVRLADALRRGYCATQPAGGRAGGLLNVDWFAYKDEPLEAMRATCNIPAKSDEAIAAGSPGVWDLAGLSIYQREHCDLTVFAEHGARPAN